MKHFRSVGIASIALLTFAIGADAQEMFDLTWSGASFGNNAQAIGTITMDPTLLGSGYTDNSGIFFPPAVDYVSALSMTVSGASSGNGTFSLADFDTVLFDPNGASLDFTTELVGQPTAGSSWGTPDGNGGDFNLFNLTNPGQPDAPDGVFNFTLVTNAGLGDEMLLTSFAPATPEPGTMALLVGLGLSGVAFLRRRRKR